MAKIISATTRFVGAGTGVDRGTRRADFILKARALLAQSRSHREAGEWELALETAYQAALRSAGARISGSAVSKRRRRPSGAWEQLRLVDESGERRAGEFEQYSRLRSRVASGLEPDVDHGIVNRIMSMAEEFLAEVELEAGWTTAAA